MTQDLRERVARAIAKTVYERVPAQTPSHQFNNEQWDMLAAAALTVALEEAARVAENNEGKARWQGEHIAAAIRSLIPKAPESP